MGGLATKCANIFYEDKDISKQDDDEEDINKRNETNLNKARIIKKNNIYHISDIIVPAKTITINNKEQIIDDISLSKIEKIQNTYHKHYLQKKFKTEIKPSITKKTKEYMNQKYLILSTKGDVTKYLEKFSPDNWQRYYPSDDQFFSPIKGVAYENQIRIKNGDDLNNIEIYEGEMSDKNLKHGKGILTTPHYVLKGTWRNDQFTGWGIKCKRNGDNLEGKFINGELNGKGVFKNGNDLYEGEFINGKRWGYGDLTTEKYHYKGQFKNDKMEGKGEIEFFEDGQRYEGNFKENEINGKGIYKWKNGDIYEGNMKKGKMDGNGKYTYNDGKIYEGEYVNDIKEGKGKISYLDGRSYEGYFVNGYLEGETLCFENNKCYKALFSKGKFKQKL